MRFFTDTSKYLEYYEFMASKYCPKAQEKVHKALHEMKQDKLRAGNSKKKVTDRKQAIAIGLSEARESGAKVPKKATR